jgi:hypothetical protein
MKLKNSTIAKLQRVAILVASFVAALLLLLWMGLIVWVILTAKPAIYLGSNGKCFTYYRGFKQPISCPVDMLTPQAH